MSGSLRGRVRQFWLWIALAVSLALLGWLAPRFYQIQQRPVGDFTEYWTAARICLERGNPYDPAQMRTQQQALGRSNARPLMMYNPPWALTWMLPFGLLEYGLAKVLWLLVCLGIVLVVADQVWRLYGGSPRGRWIAWIMALSFVPVLFALKGGQIIPLALLGTWLFFYGVRQRRWGWAGAAVVLTTVKPQLLYLFWLVLLLWIWQERCWAMVRGAGLALVISLAVPLALNPRVLQQYVQVMLTYPPSNFYAPPTLGTLLRLLLGVEHTWLQFVPLAIGSVWSMFYWFRNRCTWCWEVQLPVLLLVSLVLGAYNWTHDQVVFLLPLLHLAVWLHRSQRQAWIACGIGLYVLANGAGLVMNFLRVGELWYIWMGTFWLLMYAGGMWLVTLLAMKELSREPCVAS